MNGRTCENKYGVNGRAQPHMTFVTDSETCENDVDQFQPVLFLLNKNKNRQKLKVKDGMKLCYDGIIEQKLLLGGLLKLVKG